MSLVFFLTGTVSVPVRAEEPAVSAAAVSADSGSAFTADVAAADASANSELIPSEATPSEATPSDASVSSEAAASSDTTPVRLTGMWLRFRQLVDVHLRTPREESTAEQKVYSYVQMPWSNYKNIKWTGSWNGIEAGGQKFSNFGCGICALSNIYSTLTGEAVTPYTMFEWCKEYSNYRPRNGQGAIDWKELGQMCSHFGFDAETLRKPADYETFQKHVSQSEAVMVLVCKDNSEKLWFYTNGHYVSLFDYDPADDTVFVADSSGLWNRQRVALKDVYDSLKTRSDAQYMTVRTLK